MKIAVFTGSRADYGPLRWFMQEVAQSTAHELLVFVTGSHLSEKYGSTLEEISRDGFEITETIEILMDSESRGSIAKSTGLTFIGCAEIFSKHEPDLLVVLGDRYEAFAAVSSAFLMKIPVAHIAGGELTEGALDDNLRHAMTKMSDIHFPSTVEYGRRILQLGEVEESIFVVGATGLDNFANTPLIPETELSEVLNFNFKERPIALCTFHPETKTSAENDNQGISPLLEALSSRTDLRVVFTAANADQGGNIFNEAIQNFVAENSSRAILVPNLGQQKYISAMQLVDVVIGNSSSGIIEAPTAGVPTLNIGNRQEGRIRAKSVIDVKNSSNEISLGLNQALSHEMRKIAAKRNSPFGTPGASKRIFEVLNQMDINNLPQKKFMDRI